MNIQVSCAVLRCQQTSISQCAGYLRRDCSRYYCQTHSKDTLCDFCAGLKHEDMKSSYRQMLSNLERKSYLASRTNGIVALFLLSLMLLAAAVVCAFMNLNDQETLVSFVITLGSGVLFFFASIIWYLMKAREYIRTESLEFDQHYPGFYDYYQQWQAKIDEITISSNS